MAKTILVRPTSTTSSQQQLDSLQKTSNLNKIKRTCQNFKTPIVIEPQAKTTTIKLTNIQATRKEEKKQTKIVEKTRAATVIK